MERPGFTCTFTIFTPTYNRAHTLPRVYESLSKQTFRDFEWLVIDDGSTDETAGLLKKIQKEAEFPVRVEVQENQGKLVALNRAVEMARGRFFLTLDSDDSCLPESLEKFLAYWNSIPAGAREGFSGVTVLCRDQRGRLVGDRFPGDPFDSDSLSNRYVYRIKGEKWGFQRTELLRKFPFPPIKGIGLSVVWNRIGRQFKTRYVNEVLRVYHIDEDDRSITAEKNRTLLNPEGRAFSRLELLNNDLDYFRHAPLHFLKAFVQYARFSYHAGMSLPAMVFRLQGVVRRAVLIGLIPVAWVIVAFDRIRYDRAGKARGKSAAVEADGLK